MAPSVQRITQAEKKQIEATFGRFVNSGQVKYLKAGHLDVLETDRQGIHFVNPVIGEQIFDCFSSAGSFNVGRHNPEILAALDHALATLDLGTPGMVSEHKLALAQKLVDISPGDLNRVWFGSGGGDVVDAALKLARAATGRSEIIATIKGYHGHTGFSLGANGKEHYRHYCEPLIPDFTFVPFNDWPAIQRAITEKTAAVILEPIQGEAGIFAADESYLKAVRKRCDEVGALLIFDEIQTGWGRTGRMFASEHTGIVPDMMTVAKSMGGGLYANAALLFRPLKPLVNYIDSHPDFHPSTTGGSDLGCAVSLAVIDFIEKNRLWENAEAMGERLAGALRRLQAENPKIIKEVRGKGLMIGIEYLHEFMGPMMSDALAQNGVFAAYSGNAPQVMRFMVPIVINENEMDELIVRIGRAVATMKKLLPFALPAAKFPPVLKLLNSEKVQTVLFGWVRKVEDAVNSVKGVRS